MYRRNTASPGIFVLDNTKIQGDPMKKFFALLFVNILLIQIGSVPQLGRLYAYPIYRFFTGYGYENELFCNPLWCFITKWPYIFVRSIGGLSIFLSMGIMWTLPPVITVAFYFYCDWKNKWTWFIYGVFVISCLFSMPIPIETGRSQPFIHYWSRIY